MAAGNRGPVIRLQGGVQDRWEYYEQDFLDCILAAQRMGRTTTDGPGWPLGYERPISGLIWTWAGGRNCHPIADVDPELLEPYGDAVLANAS
ncbi:hypothetical protein ABZS29_38465 [Kribbella sp. NPDC005582]|uniref:hypothetical protein n=1 Tax=Kribbella sp. NPDC005582 TaxID=3156893 RepID=UPI0033B56573